MVRFIKYKVYIAYMLKSISVRVQNEMKEEIDEFTKSQKMKQTSEGARKLLALGLEEWRKETALNLFEEGKVTLSKAAEIAKLNVLDMFDLIKSKGIVWIKNKDFIISDLNSNL